MGFDPEAGKYKTKWIPAGDTKREAETKRAELIHQLDTGTFIMPGKTTLAEYLQQWLMDYAKPKLCPRSYDRYADIIRQHINPKLGKTPLTQLKPAQLQNLYSEWLSNGLSNRTVKYHHAVIHNALRCALKWGMVGRNVADAVETPKARQNEMQVWSDYEVSRFLEYAEDSPYFALFYTALFTGMRRSELLALRWSDVDLLMGEIQVSRGLQQLKDSSLVFSQPKSAKSNRKIALSPSTIQVLREHYEKQKAEMANLGRKITDDSLVFSHIDGTPIRPNTITYAWVNTVKRSGLKAIRFHDLRHTHASLMLQQGVHPKIVQERLGHSSISMTLDTYSHVAPGLQEAAAKGFDELVVPKREKVLVENHL
jgi:integrase